MKNNYNNDHSYDDIINEPHHQSQKHPPMSGLDRAAQFSPFAALSGYEEAVKEMARLTESKAELNESDLKTLNDHLNWLTNSNNHPLISVTFFVADEKKSGGSYKTITNSFKRIDPYALTVILENGQEISISDIFKIQSDCFPKVEND